MASWRQDVGLRGLVGLNHCNCYETNRCYFSGIIYRLIKVVFIVNVFLRKVAIISGGLTA